MKISIKKTLKLISTTLVALVVLLALLLHGVSFFGLKPYCVLSGSMESVYPTGSMIYVTKTDPAALQVNDIITFITSGDIVATHRIIELVPDKTDPTLIRFRTKGDENDIADGSLVGYGDVIGKPVLCIPLLGFLATYIMHPPGKYLAIAVSAALILFEIIVNLLPDDKKNEPHLNKNNKEISV